MRKVLRQTFFTFSSYHEQVPLSYRASRCCINDLYRFVLLGKMIHSYNTRILWAKWWKQFHCCELSETGVVTESSYHVHCHLGGYCSLYWFPCLRNAEKREGISRVGLALIINFIHYFLLSFTVTVYLRNDRQDTLFRKL